MVRGMFSKLNNAVKWLYNSILNMPFLIKDQFKVFTESFKSFKYNIKNFADVNVKLGVYHLNNQNYNDAIFRFKLVDKFFRPNDPFVNYWLGWAYFLKKDHKKAKIHLQKGQAEDKVKLLEFIRHINTATEVPDQIYSIYRSINAETIVGKFVSDEDHDFPKFMVIALIELMNDLPEESKILELGSNVGLVGHEMHKRINNDNFSLTGIESSSEMIYLQGACDRSAFYNKVLNIPVIEYLQDSDDAVYDVVLSLDGFSNYTDLNEVFNHVYSILESEGYFIFIIRVNNSITTLSEKYLEFSYNKDDVNNLLQQNGFKIVSMSDLGLVMKNNYFIFVCKKL